MSPDAVVPSMIVIGVDGSDVSGRAARWGLRQAVLTGAAVRAVSSWRWPNYVTRVPPGVDLPGETTTVLSQTIAAAVAAVPGADEIEVTQRVLEGPPGPALLSLAGDADLLVVGASGRAAYPGMLLGSVAEYCVRNGPCPVVVVRAITGDG